MLDYVIILLYLAALTLLSLLINWLFGVNEWLFADRIRAQLTGFFLITLPVALYFAFGESSVQQATWGKKRAGIEWSQITNGARISFWRSLARTFLKFIPWELSHTLIWQISFSPQANSAFDQLRFYSGLCVNWLEYRQPAHDAKNIKHFMIFLPKHM